MMHLPSLPLLPAVLLLLTPSTSTATKVSPSTLRALEDNGYQYLEDLSGYQMEFGKCVRVKVPDDGDDEGNSYFYNGHYYAQGQQFASVYLCDAYSADSDNQCGICDTSKEYVTDLATYLETTLTYASIMCQSCDAKCGQRRLEDEAGEEVEYMNVDCNSCQQTCNGMNFDYINNDDDNNNNNAYIDETQYLECQEAFQDENGIQIYAGPQCDSSGDIIIGFYYDDECTVKSSSATMDFGFGYGTFQGLQQMCLSCNPYGNGEDETCADLYGQATHCSNGRDLSGQEEDMPICKSYQKAHKEHFYGKRKRSWKVVEVIVAVVLVGGLVWSFLTLSWTYYLRHRSAKKDAKIPLTEADHHSEPQVMVVNKQDLPSVA